MTNKIAPGTTNSATTQGYGNLTLKRGVVTNEASAKGGTDVAIEMLTLSHEGFETEAEAMADTLDLITTGDAAGSAQSDLSAWEVYTGKPVPPDAESDSSKAHPALLVWPWEMTEAESGIRFGDGLSGRTPVDATNAGRVPAHTPDWSNPNDSDPGVTYDGF